MAGKIFPCKNIESGRKVWYNQDMKKKTTIEEDRRARAEKHVLSCPNCGSPVLDHMTQCPKCKAKLTPKGYQPMSDEKIKKIRYITYTIGAVISIAIIVLIIVFRK